ncbi:MAG: peptide chain release factor N(5)-glutamine methyltransferase [Burkholderiales bacterium]|nr:peptide chain release factor N(5)-glutamine methyltransferase [Burkholderiales bacterium]
MNRLTVAQALAEAASLGLDRLDAQWLLGHVLGQGRTWMLTHEDQSLPADMVGVWQGLVQRRVAGEPFAYLVGERDFHGLKLHVSPAVLVPRPDTETLVDWALELLAADLAAQAVPKVIDLGTGSGAIALAVKHRWPSAHMLALDASSEALAQAQANSRALNLAVEFRPSDWWQAVAGQRFALALSNPPYIAEGDPHLAALSHEPLQALASGPDGLDAIRRIVADAAAHLLPGAWLLLEHGWDQAAAVRALLQAASFEQVATRRDLGQQERCTGGRWPD